MENYRIKRTDPNNIAIQRKAGKNLQRWETISYHGHSLNSLISGLFNLIMRDYTPEDKKLLEQVSGLQLELVSGIDRIERIIEEYNEQSD
jgi:hypothetical protein